MKSFIAAVALAVICAGCATGKHVYSEDGKCVTCWNNPLTGKPINHDGQLPEQGASQVATADTNSQTTAAEVVSSTPAETSSRVSIDPNTQAATREYQVAFTVPVDVDTAYLKIKREFRYQTDREIDQEWGSLASTKKQTFSYAYDATPGVFYQMRAHREHNGAKAVIDSKIEKAGEGSSKVIVTYWLDSAVADTDAFSHSLQQRITRALNQ